MLAQWSTETHINRAIARLGATTYLEIGVRAGACLHRVSAARKVGVDPCRQGFRERSASDVYCEMPSDEFFESRAPELFASSPIEVAFVDGLHEFRQALRDVMNVERFLSPRGVVFLHDCNPASRRRAEVRDGGVWNGDVWKAAVYIRRERPDLRLFTLDCSEGLGVITGFGLRSEAVGASEAELDAYKALDYGLLEREREKILDLKSPLYSLWFFGALHRLAAGRRL